MRGASIVGRAAPGARDEALAAVVARAALGSAGPLLAALANFLAAILIWATQSPAAFGLFSLLMVVLQLSYGLSNALIGTPLAVLRDGTNRLTIERSILSAQLPLTLAAMFAAAAFAWLTGVAAAACVALMLVGNLRWTARGWAIADGDLRASAWSDGIYAVAAVAALASLAAVDRLTLEASIWTLAGAHSLALIRASSDYLRLQLIAVTAFDLRAYRRHVWPHQARWATVGVVTTEASSNAHAYLVAGALGPTAFAPIALGALFWRPLTVVLGALMQIERPRFSRLVEASSWQRALRSGLLVGIGSWAANAAAAAILMALLVPQIEARGYDAGAVVAIVAIWAAIMALRAVRNPLSTVLQAAHRFRALAWCSVLSAAVSVAGVALLLPFGAAHSLIGILLGEAVLLGAIGGCYRRIAA